MTAASRAMKARRSSVVACGHYVLVGQLIARVGDRRWVCIECALAGTAGQVAAVILEDQDLPAPQVGG